MFFGSKYANYNHTLVTLTLFFVHGLGLFNFEVALRTEFMGKRGSFFLFP